MEVATYNHKLLSCKLDVMHLYFSKLSLKAIDHSTFKNLKHHHFKQFKLPISINVEATCSKPNNVFFLQQTVLFPGRAEKLFRRGAGSNPR